MKKGLAIIGITAALIAGYFIFFDKKTEEAAKTPEISQRVAISKNSDSFNIAFNKVLNSYYALHAALVNWDSTSADMQADSIRGFLKQFPLNELPDTDGTWEKASMLAESTAAEVEGFRGENTLNGKRKSFYVLSEYLYNLIKAVRYDQQVIYHDKCPMAFNDTETAFWISNSEEILNPYLGNKHPKYKSAMQHCGSIEDSVDYRIK